MTKDINSDIDINININTEIDIEIDIDKINTDASNMIFCSRLFFGFSIKI